ncbi:hypothetical protein K4K51_006871 [Colletotrichum sp. SAR 10_75]|nr:hypothetical protein K4K51_006871 [Colletotrichum sp. SAR 10_75]
MAVVTVQMPIKHIEAVAHQVPSSEHLHDAAGQETFRWMLSDTERAHICKLLNIDAGFVFDREREICAGCGKYSGHDDLVDTALKMKVHSPEFILDGLLTGKPSPMFRLKQHELGKHKSALCQ